MYSRFKSSASVGETNVTTYARNITSGDFVSTIEAGTTGAPKAKNAKTQAKSYIMFATSDPGFELYSADSGIKLEVTGNEELRALIKALKFALDVLEDQNNKVDD